MPQAVRFPLRVLVPVLAAAVLLLGALGWLAARGPINTGIPGIGGPFALVDQTGKPMTEQALLGKPTLMFFGYTHCPDICPTTLFQMSELLKALGPQPGVNAVYVTVDPERDTTKVMADYLTSFDPHIVALTGDRPAVDAMLKTYRVYSKKTPSKDGSDYTMDHSALVYLMGKDGRFLSAFNLEQPIPEQVAQLRRVM